VEIHHKVVVIIMNLLHKLWKAIQGKKTSIGMIAQSVVVYLTASGRLGTDEAILATCILSALGLTANVSNAVIKARDKAKNDAN
jgi:hypothetical protein